MTESALKFGPEWLRALSQGTNVASPPPSPGLPKFKLAEYRYGREEMLLYFPKDIKMPPDLRQFPGVFKEQVQSPVTLVALTEEEQRIWTRSVNSDAVLRLMGKGSNGTGGAPAPRGGRGGSVDRGRGRGRASYYQRGISLEDGGDTPAPGFTRQRSYERGNGIVERGAVWDERERRYDKGYPGRDDDSGVPLRKDNSRSALDWRSLKSRDDRDRDGEEDGGGWRVSGGNSRTEKWGRSSWRNDKGDREHGDQGSDWPSSSKGPYRKTNSHHRVWEDDVNSGNDLLPEWSTEDNKDAESVGTFDATGAFMETKEDNHKLKAKENSDEPHENDISQTQQRSRKKSDSNSSAVSSSAASEEDSDSPTLLNHQDMRKSSSPHVVSSAVVEHLEESNTVLEAKEDVIASPVTLENAETSLNPIQQTSINEPSSPTNKKEELNFEHLEKAAENLVDTWTAEEDEKVEVGHISSSTGSQWFYRDPQGIVQGPFTDAEMMEWFRVGYFDMTLLVRHGLEGRFCQLGDMVKQWGRVPFLSSSVSASSPTISQTTPSNTSVLNGLLGAATLPLNHQPELPNDEHLRLLQQHPHIFHQRLINQQHFLQQQQQLYIRQQFQVLGGMKPTENFQPLTAQQQQQYFAVQRLMAQQHQQQQHQQQQHHPPGVVPRVPIESNGGLSDPFRQFMASIIPSQPQSVKENNQSLWNLPPRNGMADVSPRWTTVTSQSASVWDLESVPHESSISTSRLLPDVLEQEKKFLEEQHKKLLNEEEMQRKQEEEAEHLRRRQQEEEEERERERLIREEMHRREEEERRKREELLAQQREIEERKQREAEEQRRKEEELRKQQEERRRQVEQEKEERRKQEELRKQEEERLRHQQELLRMQEEQHRLEELRRQEEERRRLEEEQEKRKLEYQKELQRQLETKKAQQDAIRRLQEKQKAPAWGGQIAKVSENSLSLAEIQRLQEEKDRQEKLELQLQQQLIFHEQQLQQQHQAAQQAKAASLTWAKRPTSDGGAVKSLLEIQQEESDKLAQQQMEQSIKKQQCNNMSLATAGVWSNASNHLLRTSAPSSSPWNVENSIANSHSAGFWEDIEPITNGSKVHFGSANKALNKRNLSCTVNNNGPSGNKTRSMRARKDEETVMKLFEVHSQNIDEFTQWCNDTLRSLQATIDVPTFVTFLKDVESPYEVYDYVRVYLGESKEAHNFAKQFLEKRSKYRNQARKKEENMWGPAPAITPSLSKPQQLSELDGQKAPGTKKKKKNKMQKVDSAYLGFTVHASGDRINVGVIDHVDD